MNRTLTIPIRLVSSSQQFNRCRLTTYSVRATRFKSRISSRIKTSTEHSCIAQQSELSKQQHKHTESINCPIQTIRAAFVLRIGDIQSADINCSQSRNNAIQTMHKNKSIEQHQHFHQEQKFKCHASRTNWQRSVQLAQTQAVQLQHASELATVPGRNSTTFKVRIVLGPNSSKQRLDRQWEQVACVQKKCCANYNNN